MKQGPNPVSFQQPKYPTLRDCVHRLTDMQSAEQFRMPILQAENTNRSISKLMLNVAPHPCCMGMSAHSACRRSLPGELHSNLEVIK